MTIQLLVLICLVATAYGELLNVALGKPTAISSNFSYATDSSKAVDGILEATVYTTGPSDCFHTGKEPGGGEWFMVDLQETYTVDSVNILNRGDCCEERLSHFKVVVTEQKTDHPEDSPPSALCIYREARLPGGQLTELDCNDNVTGRFVYVVLLSEEFLHFCEIQVMADVAQDGQQGCQLTEAEDYFTVGLTYNQTVAFYDVKVTRQPVEPCQVLGSLDDLQNVALHKPVEVSTNYSKGYNTPEKAVDGSLQNSHISYCFHTNSGMYQWFRVDLQAMHLVFAVNIINRGDCCGERLRNFQIVVTDEPTDRPELASGRTCIYHVDPVPTAATVNLTCDKPLVGRYVTLVLMDYDILNFCEIQVMGRPAASCLPSLTSGEEPLQNIALHKPVAISSKDSSHYDTPEKAVDGDLRFDMPNCFQTKAGKNQWFRVTLQEEYTIDSVYITSSDGSLKNFKIVVTRDPTSSPQNAPAENVCASRDEAVPMATTVALKCQKPMPGWYVTVVQLVDQPLRFCELQVMGRPAVPYQPPISADDLQNVALHKPVAISSSSRQGYNTPEKAVDGDLNCDSMENCFQTAVQTNPWFRVDLQAQYLVFSVKITDRRDCGGDLLKDFKVVVTNQPCYSPESSTPNTTCVQRKDHVAQGATEELKCDRPLLGRYVTVVLLYPQALHFCELEVMGRPLLACLPFDTSNNLLNFALFKPVAVSSNYSRGYKTPQKAVDGSLRSSHISYCFHTNKGMYQWFRVDLQTQFVVYSVIITNRGECCGHRLKNFDVVVTDQPSDSPQDSAEDTLCLHRQDKVGQGATTELVCRQPLVGRYVTVVQLHGDHMHFCELQVMAKPLAACMPLVASTVILLFSSASTTAAAAATTTTTTTTTLPPPPPPPPPVSLPRTTKEVTFPIH